MMNAEKLGINMKNKPYDNSQETRVALLEQSINHIGETLIRFEKNLEKKFSDADKRFDKVEQRLEKMESRIDKVNDRLWSNFLWTLGAMFTLSTLACGIMAKGFNWFN